MSVVGYHPFIIKLYPSVAFVRPDIKYTVIDIKSVHQPSANSLSAHPRRITGWINEQSFHAARWSRGSFGRRSDSEIVRGHWGRKPRSSKPYKNQNNA